MAAGFDRARSLIANAHANLPPFLYSLSRLLAMTLDPVSRFAARLCDNASASRIIIAHSTISPVRQIFLINLYRRPYTGTLWVV